MKKAIGGEDGEGGGARIGSGRKDIVKLDEAWVAYILLVLIPVYQICRFVDQIY